MTESLWFTSADPAPLLDHVAVHGSARKLRLCAVACCRRSFSLLSSRRSREAIEAAERSADGETDDETLAGAEQVAAQATMDEGFFLMPAAAAAACAAVASADEALRTVFQAYRQKAIRDAVYNCALPREEAEAAATATAEENGIQCDLLYEVFGNPFRPVILDRRVTLWNDGCVVRLARHIYEERRWSELPILGDALADAGCASEELFAHLYQGCDHVRGCWALDVVLGRS
jgi:hypothetical protein